MQWLRDRHEMLSRAFLARFPGDLCPAPEGDAPQDLVNANQAIVARLNDRSPTYVSYGDPVVVDPVDVLPDRKAPGPVRAHR